FYSYPKTICPLQASAILRQLLNSSHRQTEVQLKMPASAQDIEAMLQSMKADGAIAIARTISGTQDNFIRAGQGGSPQGAGYEEKIAETFLTAASQMANKAREYALGNGPVAAGPLETVLA